jgi:hypothetical protein
MGNLSDAEREQRRAASTTHGLTAGVPLPAVPAPGLANRAALVAEVEQLHTIAVWVVNELQRSPVLSRGERLALTYADIAGRCNEAAVVIDAGRFTHRYRQAAQATGQTGRQQAAIERQAVIATFILGKVKGAAKWLHENGLTTEGLPRPVLGYYGTYIESGRRNCLVLAALLASEDADDLSAARVLESLPNGHTE